MDASILGTIAGVLGVLEFVVVLIWTHGIFEIDDFLPYLGFCFVTAIWGGITDLIIRALPYDATGITTVNVMALVGLPIAVILLLRIIFIDPESYI